MQTLQPIKASFATPNYSSSQAHSPVHPIRYSVPTVFGYDPNDHWAVQQENIRRGKEFKLAGSGKKKKPPQKPKSRRGILRIPTINQLKALIKQEDHFNNLPEGGQGSLFPAIALLIQSALSYLS